MGDDPKKEAPVSAVRPVPRSSPPETLEMLFREHGPLVFRTAYRVTGRTADAEDVLQTVFLRLATRPDPGNLGREPRAYLHRAAVNGALDLVRSRVSAAGTVALEGIPNRQIARLLGSSPAVVAVQYFRARTQLRKELLTKGGGPS